MQEFCFEIHVKHVRSVRITALQLFGTGLAKILFVMLRPETAEIASLTSATFYVTGWITHRYRPVLFLVVWKILHYFNRVKYWPVSLYVHRSMVTDKSSLEWKHFDIPSLVNTGLSLGTIFPCISHFLNFPESSFITQWKGNSEFISLLTWKEIISKLYM